jgi:hypothetical protein
MTFDLSNPQEFTLANVRQLIASGDVRTATQLRVSLSGRVDLVPANKYDSNDRFAFRLTPWFPKDKRVGSEAARNDDWVIRVYALLRDNWPHPTSRLINPDDPLASDPVDKSSTP